VSPVTGEGRLWLGLAHQTVRLSLHFPNYAEGSITDDVQRFVEVQQRRHGVGSQGGGYVKEWVDEPLEEVGDVEGNSRVLLNFVESDGLSRVRVCHVGFTPFILDQRPTEFWLGDMASLERGGELSIWVFGRDAERRSEE